MFLFACTFISSKSIIDNQLSRYPLDGVVVTCMFVRVAKADVKAKKQCLFTNGYPSNQEECQAHGSNSLPGTFSTEVG